MAACPGCGASNEPGLARCEYCGAALADASTMLVEWSASTHEGARANGQAELTVPAGAEASQVKAQIQAAYSKAVDALGPTASLEEIRDALWQELERLLPSEQRLKDLTVHAHGVEADAAAPSGQGGGCAVGVLLTGALTLCSLCCGFGGLFMHQDLVHKSEVAERAQVVTLDEAGATTGLVCLESAVAQVDSGLLLPGAEEGGHYLYLKAEGTGAPEPQSVERFRLGEWTVETAGLKWHDAPDLKVKSETGARWHGFKADQPLTLVGEQRDGVFHGGELFLVASQPSQAALVADLREDAGFGRVAGWFCSGVGVLLLLATVALARRRR